MGAHQDQEYTWKDGGGYREQTDRFGEWKWESEEAVDQDLGLNWIIVSYPESYLAHMD
jgi:hypothetical protein